MIVETIKKHPVLVAGGLAVAVFALTRGNSSGGPSDSVVTANINAQKEIEIARINAGIDKKASQVDLIKTRITSGNQKDLGMAISKDSRVVDLSKIQTEGRVNLASSLRQLQLGKINANADVKKTSIQYGTERAIGLGAQKVALRGIETAREATFADIASRNRIAEIAGDVARARMPWDAQIANRAIDAQIAEAQLNTMLGFDNNATNVTLMKKQMGAQNLATGLGFVSDINQSNNQTAASLGNSFFGMIGDIFGGMGGMIMGGA